MAARQQHGFDNEKSVISSNDLVDVGEIEGYTSKWDARAPKANILELNKIVENVPTQIKTIRYGGSVDMGDVFRHAENTENFILQVDFYTGPKKDLNIVESHKVYVDADKWAELFEFEDYGFLKECLKEITNEYSDDSKWKGMMAEMHNRWGKDRRVIHLAPKRDHKKQKRIQCTIPNVKFYEKFLPLFNRVEYVKKSLDQFYTKPAIVESVLKMVDLSKYDLIVEPSAGAGDFLKRLPLDKSIGLDIEPATSGILRKDFFDFAPERVKNTLTIGNPPFGKNSSTAIKFFNHAAQFSDCIAFIVPRTFRKPSVINRLNENFHIVKQKILPSDSFYTPEGESRAVPTVFQIWERQEAPRTKIKTFTTHPDFDFVRIQNNPTRQQKELQCRNSDFCVRRVGGSAGKIYKDYDIIYRDWKSHYYIKQKTEGVERIMSLIRWDDRESPKFDTAGNPSISKHELIKLYKETKKKL